MKVNQRIRTFTLRTALVATAVFAGLMAYVHHLVLKGRANRELEQSVLTDDGLNLRTVTNSDIYEGNLLLPDAIANWMPDMFIPALYGITEVEIVLGTSGKSDFEAISKLPDLRVLRLGPISRPQECVAIIQSMNQLETVVVTDDFGYVFDGSVVSLFREQLPHINVVDETPYRRTMR